MRFNAKLDELLRVDGAARSELARLDEREPEEIARHRDVEVAKASAENNLKCSLHYPHYLDN